MKPVIMCGGIGTKMWPMSRRKLPKHFISLFEGKSLFQLNVETLIEMFSPTNIYIQTNQEQANLAQVQAPDIPKENIFIEPSFRNHGPATGFMAAKLYQVDPTDPFMIIQADLIRTPKEKFLKTIEEVEKLVKSEKKLVTGGERPDFAVMGVDYLIIEPTPIVKNGINFFKMNKWLGRDSKEGVKKYLEDEAALNHWNHYSWTPKLMLEAIEKYKPDWYGPLMNIMNAFGTNKENEIVESEYNKMPKGPIEEVTSHALENAYIFEVPYECVDFGTWESLTNYFRKHYQDKLKHEESVQIESENCFLKLPKGKFGATIGVKDLVIVDSGDALLVCHRDKTSKVGKVVEHLKGEKQDSLL